MGVPEAGVGKLTSLRRSQRVYLSMPVVVYKEGPEPNRSFEETRTLAVNAHGALILLRLAVPLGQLLTLKNAKTQQELVCRVVYLGPYHAGKTEVGIEFERPAPKFWHIAFPPADWSPHNPEAKGPTPHRILRR